MFRVPSFGGFRFPVSRGIQTDSMVLVPSGPLSQETQDTVLFGSQSAKVSDAKAVFRSEPVFKALGLTPSLVTPVDLNDVMQLSIQHVENEMSDEALENARLSFAKMSPAELKKIMLEFSPELKQWPEEVVDKGVRELWNDPQRFQALMRAEKTLTPEELAPQVQLLRKIFMEHPKAALIVLKNLEGKIVAFEGIHPFLKQNVDLVLNPDHFVDPAHGCVAKLYVKPEYRHKGIGEALKRTIIDYGARQLGYRYVWSATESSGRSHRTNQKLGYQPLTPETRFPDSPAFTPKQVQSLLKEYNVGTAQLQWLKTDQVEKEHVG